MRDDLRPALAAVQWAEAQIPILQERLISWQRRRPYKVVVEPDRVNTAYELLVAYPDIPLDVLIAGDIGTIVNSTRAALDILLSALLASHGIKPNSKAHFPIRKSAADFLAAVDVLEDKKWISKTEVAAIKRTKAYDGGDHVLYAIHHLDILRKHERLLTVIPTISEAWITAFGPDYERLIQSVNDKTILYRIPARRFRPTPGNTNISAEIFLNEPAVGVANKPAVIALKVFTQRVRALVMDFP